METKYTIIKVLSAMMLLVVFTAGAIAQTVVNENGDFSDATVGQESEITNWQLEGTDNADFEVVEDPDDESNLVLQVTLGDISDLDAWTVQAIHQNTQFAAGHEAAQPNFSEFYQDTIKSRLNAGLNFEILNYTEGQVDAKEYLRLLDEVYIMENSQTAGIEEHKKFITEALKRDRIIEKAKEMGLDEHILNPNRQNQILQNRVIQLYNIEKIDSKVPEPNELDLKEFYETHKESLFYQPPRVRIFALIYDENDKAEDAIRRYEEGVRFEDLETGYQVRTFEKNRNGEIESYMRRENPYLGNAAFSINEGDVYGPEEYHHFEYGKQYAVIKSVNNQSERYISFEEAGERVKEEFHRCHRQQISDSLKQALWDQYPVVIYRNQLVKNIDGR